MARNFCLLMALSVLVTLGASQAAAAPQNLGLIARVDPITLQCENGECGAEFTAFCVERYRTSPTPGTAYYVHNRDTLAIEGVRQDGTTISLDIANLLTIKTERGHSAVRISVPSSVLKRLDVASVRVSVHRNATLIPDPIPDDPRPQTELDIALATGPLRTAAAVVVDEAGDLVGAARVMASVINVLPRHGRAGDDMRKAAWQASSPSIGTPGYSLARQGFERCYDSTRAGLQSLRQCLGSEHDSFIGELNTQYWHALEIGS